MIRIYRYLLSPFMGRSCRFYPTCSSYSIDAIQHKGLFHGFYLTLKRILRCHPWAEGGFDPVPE